MIKRLASCIREYKKSTIWTPIFVMAEVVMEVLIPLIMANLIDYGIDAGNLSVVARDGILLLVAAICSMFFGVAAGVTASRASAGFAKNLRHDMYYKVQEYAFSNIDRFSTASLVTRMTSDVSNVQMAFQSIIRIALRSPFMTVSALVVAFTIDAKLATIFVIFIPFLLFGLLTIAKKAHPTFQRVFKTYDKLNGVVQENLYGIRVVKTFRREDYEKKKFTDVSESIYKDFTKAEKLLAFNAPMMQTAMYTCTLLVCWFGAKAVVACGGDEKLGLSTGELMSLITYATQILMGLMMVAMIFVMSTMARTSAARIIEILDEPGDLVNPEHPIMEVPDGSICFENVTFRYNAHSDKPVLDQIRLNIASGETVGIIGGTGSSKSSLVQLIPRLYDVSSGRVLVGGHDVRDYDLEVLRNSVSMVLQKNVLFSGTIAENLRWGNPNATDEELRHACELACADEFIAQMPDGYDTHIEQGGTNVSGGQKQRLCIARALLKKPHVLILDDSTSAVDTATDAKIRKAFAEEIPGTTKLIIAQRISSVQDADHIIVMDDGKISAFGTHEELLRDSEIYREVYESQQKGGEDDE